MESVKWNTLGVINHGNSHNTFPREKLSFTMSPETIRIKLCYLYGQLFGAAKF